MSALPPVAVVQRLLDGVAGVINGDETALDPLVMLYADRTDVVHPMSAADGDPLTSHDELRAHFAPGPDDRPIPGFRATDVRFHQTTDPEVVITEFSWSAGDRSFPCVFVTRVRDGRIVESRDYVDHVRGAELFSVQMNRSEAP